MFTDNRSKRIVYVAHCLLNSNTLTQGVGTVNRFPSLTTPLIKVLLESNVGIVQLACPERDVFGLFRDKCFKDNATKKILMPHINKLVSSVCKEIEEYIKNGVKVLAIIGKRGSPTCGVKECWVSEEKLSPEPGFFMDSLMKKLKEKQIPFVDFEREEESLSIESIRKLLG